MRGGVWWGLSVGGSASSGGGAGVVAGTLCVPTARTHTHNPAQHARTQTPNHRRANLAVLGDRDGAADELGDLLELGGAKAARRQRGRADAHAAGRHRALVARHRVLVERAAWGRWVVCLEGRGGGQERQGGEEGGEGSAFAKERASATAKTLPHATHNTQHENTNSQPTPHPTPRRAHIDTRSSTDCTRAPSMPLGLRSTSTRWLSVPPLTTSKPRACSRAAIAWQLATTCVWGLGRVWLEGGRVRGGV